MTDDTEARDTSTDDELEARFEAERTALRRAREEDEKEAAIEGLVQAASVAVRVAQEEGQGAYQSTLDLADALQAARDAGLVKP